ncbi:MAG: SpoIIE family protein phosphatase [Ignavibacteriae bacterium]|nr:SpoIIE family protein phosphatase [Ignavibacteriota bacterium]
MTTTPLSSSNKEKAREERFDLSALFEFSSVINASIDLKFILGHFLLTLMGKLLSLRGIVILERANSTFTVENVKGLPTELIGQTLKINKLTDRILYVDHEDARKMPWIRFFRDQGILILIPLTLREKIVGITGLGSSVVKKKLSSKEETYIKSLASIAATAIDKGIVFSQLKQLNRRLDSKVQELNTLFELSKEFNAIFDQERLIKLLLFSIMGQIGASRYFICLQQNGAMNVVTSRLDSPINPSLPAYFPTLSSPQIVELMRKQDRQLQSLLKEIGIHVLIPLQLKNQTVGVMGLGEKMRGEKYSQLDIEFLSSLGNLAIISIENARLFKETLEKQKLEDELLIAKEIQRGLLPAQLPNIPHFDLAAVNISSKQVGGDYYDVIPLGQHRYVFAIGDVSGKGTPASLLMANLQATIRALVPLGLSLGDLTKRVNDLICENTGSDRFITFFWGILDTTAKRMNYVSAGHNPPFLFHADGAIERLDKGGIILGIMKTIVPYQEGEVKFGSGDVLLLFTDGVSEAMNSQEEEFGEEQLQQVARACLHESAGTILSKIVDAVKEHSKNRMQSDDVTLVVVKAMDR